MAEGQTNGGFPPGESGAGNGLTPIHRRIHCGATPDTTETNEELDHIAIDHFLDIMAELALAIVRRRKQLE